MVENNKRGQIPPSEALSRRQPNAETPDWDRLSEDRLRSTSYDYDLPDPSQSETQTQKPQWIDTQAEWDSPSDWEGDNTLENDSPSSTTNQPASVDSEWSSFDAEDEN